MKIDMEISKGTPDVFEKIREHEEVVFCNDPVSGLRAIIAIHDTTSGPALGGCRMYPYKSTEDALEDVLRLSKGMTQKCAAADVDFGGGKAVIIGDPTVDKSPALFRAFGRYIASLNGRFYTGTDMGTTMRDFEHAAKETDYIVGVEEAYGGSGDSSVPTSAGLISSIRAVSRHLFGHEYLGEHRYAVQGLGKVGRKAVLQLLEQGAVIYAADPDGEVCTRLIDDSQSMSGMLEIVDCSEIMKQKAEFFVPCAVGGIINEETIYSLQVKAVVGAANNQLTAPINARQLQQQNILYAPDYIVNGGGLIQVADELYGVNKERVLRKTRAIYDAILEVLRQADLESLTTLEAADQLCQQRIRERASGNNFYHTSSKPKWSIF